MINKVNSDGGTSVVTPKKWTGSNWVIAQAYRYSNGEWVNQSSQKHIDTFEAEWSQTYVTDNTKRTDYRGNMLCQGKYQNDSFGHMRSLCGFDDASMRAKLVGAKIDKVELYLRNEHWYYHGGGQVTLGYHNHANEPTTFSHSAYNQKTQQYSERGQAKWIVMPLALGTGIRDNKYKGFSIYTSSTAIAHYGVFYGANSESKPKLKITYVK